MMPDDEYRARAYRRGPRWVLPTLVTVVLVAGLACTVAYYRIYGQKALDPQVTAFHIEDHSIALTVTVTRNHSDRAVSCVLQAQAHDHGILGTATVRLPAGGKRPTVSHTITTRSRPYGGEVESCRYITN